MNLHLDREAFTELITAASNELRIPPGIVENYIYRFLKMTEQEELAEVFNLMPFEITTQAIERTFVDKVFAVCDYYLTGKVERHSRHLYDIYKILEYITPDASLSELVQEVRQLREPLPICPSAKQDVCINDVLREIIERDVYQDDYETITGKLLFTYVPYEAVVEGIKKIIDNHFFEHAVTYPITAVNTEIY